MVMCTGDCFNCPYDDCISTWHIDDYALTERTDRIIKGKKVTPLLLEAMENHRNDMLARYEQNLKAGAELIEWRKSKGMSRTELSRAVGMSDKAVYSWERGNIRPRYDLLEKAFPGEFHAT